MNEPATLDLRPLEANFGREVRGLALHEVDAAVGDALRAALYEHKLLLLRRQALRDDELRGLALLLGVPSPTGEPVAAANTISNLRDEQGNPIGGLGEGELAWHTDHAYRAHPCTLAINYMLQVPDKGGATWFCDITQGWEALPPEMRQRAAHLTGMYAANPNANTRDTGITRHPVALPHPNGRRTSLYLSERLKELGLEGMAPEEGLALIEAYLAYQLRPEHLYAHAWQTGDVLIWDGGQTLHRRDSFQGPRLMKSVRGHLPPDQFAVPQGQWDNTDPASMPHWFFNHAQRDHYRA